jgi:hypothetical protein
MFDGTLFSESGLHLGVSLHSSARQNEEQLLRQNISYWPDTVLATENVGENHKMKTLYTPTVFLRLPTFPAHLTASPEDRRHQPQQATEKMIREVDISGSSTVRDPWISRRASVTTVSRMCSESKAHRFINSAKM